MALKCVIFFLLFSIELFSQFEKGTIDTVYSYTFGSNTQFGQSPEFFPQNIFGLPDSLARMDIPSSSEQQICALGLNGTITIGFKGKMLRDMPGKDFTIFENAFEFMAGRVFIEPAMVQVSKDGINFISFPFDSLTLQGCSGITPTNGNYDIFNPLYSGGNSFDLSDIGIDSVIAIRIIDVSSLILNPEHPLYSPIVNGFDLDAVVGIHLQDNSLLTSVDNQLNHTSISAFTSLKVDAKVGETIILYTIDGRQIFAVENGTFEFSTKGTYLLVVKSHQSIRRNVIQIY